MPAQNGTPRSGTIPRPPLPLDQLNPFIKNPDAAKIPPVKFQEIVRDGQATIVARMKIPTPNNHAFILRRLDTGAVSSTTMFRAAFPSATDEAERTESSYIKAAYNSNGANKSGSARFAGTWVNADVAHILADEYRLQTYMTPLVAALPGPSTSFRKSSKTQQATPGASPSQSLASDTPPVKRRREASPAVTPSRSQAAHVHAPPRRAVTPQKAVQGSPRRSTRLMSPATTPASVVTFTQVTTTVEETVPSLGSDEIAGDEEAQELAKVAEQNMQEDIREQKELISRLKAEAEAKAQAAESQLETNGEAMVGTEEPAVAPMAGLTKTKRAREEESVEYKLNIQEPEVGERAIATNRRVGVMGSMRPEQKSLAWGALLFAAGVGAISFLPSLPSFF